MYIGTVCLQMVTNASIHEIKLNDVNFWIFIKRIQMRSKDNIVCPQKWIKKIENTKHWSADFDLKLFLKQNSVLDTHVYLKNETKKAQKVTVLVQVLQYFDIEIERKGRSKWI